MNPQMLHNKPRLKMIYTRTRLRDGEAKSTSVGKSGCWTSIRERRKKEVKCNARRSYSVGPSLLRQEKQKDWKMENVLWISMQYSML